MESIGTVGTVVNEEDDVLLAVLPVILCCSLTMGNDVVPVVEVTVFVTLFVLVLLLLLFWCTKYFVTNKSSSFGKAATGLDKGAPRLRFGADFVALSFMLSFDKQKNMEVGITTGPISLAFKAKEEEAGSGEVRFLFGFSLVHMVGGFNTKTNRNGALP